MADTIYGYRTPANFPDRVRIGQDVAGDFSNLEHDSSIPGLKLQLYNDGAITGTWSFGSDGVIRFNTDAYGGGGGEFTPDQLIDIGIVADHIGEVSTVADNIEAITTLAAIEDLPDLAAVASQIEDIQDNVAVNAANAATSEANAATSEANAATSANSAADNEGGAETAQTAAEAARDQAVRYATAPPDSEVEPGLLSARGYAVRTAALARQIAAFPSREITGTTDTLIKTTASVRGDEFAMLYCTNAAPLTITLPRSWNDTPAFDGSPSWVPVRIINNGSSTVTLSGGSSVINDVVKTGTWQGSSRTDAPIGSTTPIVRVITVAAGLKRVLWIGSFETNNSVTSHVPTLASSSGVVTARVSATAPTGRYITSPRINAQSWTVALPDSASAATSVTLTFTLPANYLSHNYRVVAANNVDAISGSTGASVTTPTLTPSVSVTSLADSLVIAALCGNGSLTPATLSGATASAASASGGRVNKDSTMICGEIELASAGAHIISAAFTSDDPPNGKEAAYLGISFDKASGGGSGATVLGTPLTVGSDSWIDVMALSDGITYIVKGGI